MELILRRRSKRRIVRLQETRCLHLKVHNTLTNGQFPFKALAVNGFLSATLFDGFDIGFEVVYQLGHDRFIRQNSSSVGLVLLLMIAIVTSLSVG